MKSIYFIAIMAVTFILSGCSGCSKSARRQQMLHRTGTAARQSDRPAAGTTYEEEKTVIKMVKVNGVYQIPVEINGIPMHFIFDTGAGMISISETEATFLYKQGLLGPDDVVGKQNFMDANGEISEGTVVVLKTVKVGDKVLRDIEASVVHNLGAPLLFGQSALQKFGRVSIDYKNAEITFE